MPFVKHILIWPVALAAGVPILLIVLRASPIAPNPIYVFFVLPSLLVL
jgi:hypothetical protein